MTPHTPPTIEPGAVAVLTLDHEHRIAHCNREAELALGYAPRALAGLGIDVLRHPDLPRAVLRDIWATLEAGSSWCEPIVWRRADGGALWLRTTFAPARHADARSRSVVVGTHVGAALIDAAALIYRTMRQCDVAWRDAVLRHALRTRRSAHQGC